jgi:TolA-binding protein
LPLINFWKGELAYRSNRIDDAIRYYNAYLSAGAPTSGEANERTVKYNLGYTYYRKENYSVANTFFEPLSRGAALTSEPITQDAYIRTADVAYMNRNYTQARSMYDKVINYSWPSEDYATFQKAMIAGISNNAEKITLMNNLVRKFPQSTLVADANMEIANTYLAQERFREAIPFLNNIINASGGNTSLKPQAYLKSGIAYYNANDNEKAIAQYRQLLTNYPNSPEADDALDNLKTIYIEGGKPGEFADVARQVGRPISVGAEDSLTFAAAQIQYENNNMNAALDAMTNYIQRFGNGSKITNAYFYRGEIYNSRKDYNNAISNYAEVAKRAPNTYAETSILQAARLTFFELKNYPEAERYYAQLKQITSSQENRLEAMRGLLRSQYLQKKWSEAVDNAKNLIDEKGASSDDKSLANMAIGKSAQIGGQYDVALNAFKAVVAVNKAALGAEARYEVANTWFMTDRFSDAEKAAFEVVNKSGSYDYWVTKSYILLGDIYLRQKDYFNAKATFQSIVQNSLNAELKAEAQAKLAKVNEEEAKGSKVGL